MSRPHVEVQNTVGSPISAIQVCKLSQKWPRVPSQRMERDTIRPEGYELHILVNEEWTCSYGSRGHTPKKETESRIVVMLTSCSILNSLRL